MYIKVRATALLACIPMKRGSRPCVMVVTRYVRPASEKRPLRKSPLRGIEFVAVAIGLFGIAEVLANVDQPLEKLEQSVIVPRFRDLYPSLQDLKASVGAILRGAGIGFGVGLVPGPAPVIATYASYMTEKRISKHPEAFGKGAIEGAILDNFKAVVRVSGGANTGRTCYIDTPHGPKKIIFNPQAPYCCLRNQSPRIR